MKWSAAKEILKTFGVLALDVLAFFCVMTLLVAAFVTVIVGVFSVLWFWLDLIF